MHPLRMIDVQQITKRYGQHTAIDRVTFSVAKGEVLAFLGPNGAGKTTTMRILTGFMPASEGTARVAGFDCADQALELPLASVGGRSSASWPLDVDLAVRVEARYLASSAH